MWHGMIIFAQQWASVENGVPHMVMYPSVGCVSNLVIYWTGPLIPMILGNKLTIPPYTTRGRAFS